MLSYIRPNVTVQIVDHFVPYQRGQIPPHVSEAPATGRRACAGRGRLAGAPGGGAWRGGVGELQDGRLAC